MSACRWARGRSADSDDAPRARVREAAPARHGTRGPSDRRSTVAAAHRPVPGPPPVAAAPSACRPRAGPADADVLAAPGLPPARAQPLPEDRRLRPGRRAGLELADR